MQVSAAVTEDGVYLLISELEKALEEPGMRRPAAEAITHYCRNSRIKFEEHWDSLLGVSLGLAAHRPGPPVVSHLAGSAACCTATACSWARHLLLAAAPALRHLIHFAACLLLLGDHQQRCLPASAFSC